MRLGVQAGSESICAARPGRASGRVFLVHCVLLRWLAPCWSPRSHHSEPGLSLILVTRLRPSGKWQQHACLFPSLLELFLLGRMSPFQEKMCDLVIIGVQGIITSLTREALAAQGCANYLSTPASLSRNKVNWRIPGYVHRRVLSEDQASLSKSN